MFRFTIRDVLWLAVVVALAAGWWIDHLRTARTLRVLSGWEERHDRVVEAMRERGWEIDWIQMGGESLIIHPIDPPPANPNRP